MELKLWAQHRHISILYFMNNLQIYYVVLEKSIYVLKLRMTSSRGLANIADFQNRRRMSLRREKSKPCTCLYNIF